MQDCYRITVDIRTDIDQGYRVWSKHSITQMQLRLRSMVYIDVECRCMASVVQECQTWFSS